MLSILSFVSTYKTLIKNLLLATIVIITIGYIKYQNHQLNRKDEDIAKLNEKYTKDKAIWELNNNILTKANEDQNNQIEKLRTDSKNNEKIFNKKIIVIKSEYEKKMANAFTFNNLPFEEQCKKVFSTIDSEFK